MIRLASILLLLLFCASSHAQKTSFPLERRYEGDVVDFTVDNLGNVYLLYNTNQIKKLNANGDSMGVFNATRRYGTLYSMDVSNPLKVLLYYRDFGTVVALDRFLAIRNTLDLRQLNIFQAKAVGLSYDNNIWVFDEQEGKLKKISEEGKIIDQTNDLRQLFDSLPSPDQLIDRERLVYLYDSTKGFYVFDYYGSLKNRVRLLHWRDISVVDKSVFGHNDGKLLRYDSGTLNIQEIPMPAAWKTAKRIHIRPGKIYVLNKGVLEIYTVS